MQISMRLLIPIMLWGAVAHAQSRPTLIAVPLDLDPNPSLTRFEAQLRQEFVRMLDERSNTTLASRKETEASIKDSKRQDFRESDEGLAKLAASAKSLYALYVVLELTPQNKLVLSGRVVREDGKRMKAAKVELAKGADTVPGLFKPLMSQLIVQLELATLPASKELPVVAAPVLAKGPEPEPSINTPPVLPPPSLVGTPPTSSGPRSVGQGLVIAGGGVAVIGAVLFGIGQGMGGSLTPNLEKNLPREQLGSFVSARTLSTAGVVCAAVGAASALVGGILWGTSPKESKVSAAVVPQAGGVTFGVQGAF